MRKLLRYLLLLLISASVSSSHLAAQSKSPACDGLKPITTEELVKRDELACSIISKRPCEWIPAQSHKLIFVGKVKKIVESPSVLLLDGKCVESIAQLVTVEVTESFSGGLPAMITIHAGRLNGEFFQANEVALIVASKLADGTFTVSGCSGTTPIGKDWPGAKAALDYLHSRNTFPPTGMLILSTFVVPPDDGHGKYIGVGLGAQNISITGARTLRLTTDKTGSAKLENLPPGRYSIHIDSPLPLLSENDKSVDLQPKGCADVTFYSESALEWHRIVDAHRKLVKKR